MITKSLLSSFMGCFAVIILSLSITLSVLLYKKEPNYKPILDTLIFFTVAEVVVIVLYKSLLRSYRERRNNNDDNNNNNNGEPQISLELQPISSTIQGEGDGEGNGDGDGEGNGDGDGDGDGDGNGDGEGDAVVRVESLKLKQEDVRDILTNVFLPWHNASRLLVQSCDQLKIDKKVTFIYDNKRLYSSMSLNTNVMDTWIVSYTQTLLDFVKQEREGKLTNIDLLSRRSCILFIQMSDVGLL
jgi:hypothetical protein